MHISTLFDDSIDEVRVSVPTYIRIVPHISVSSNCVFFLRGLNQIRFSNSHPHFHVQCVVGDGQA